MVAKSSLANSPAQAVVGPPGGDSKGQTQSSDDLTSSSGADVNGPSSKKNQAASSSASYSSKTVSEGDASSEETNVAAPSEDVKAKATVISDGVAEAEATKATATTTSGSSPDVEMTKAEASSEIAAVAAPSEDVKARTTVISVGVAEAEATKATATTTSGSSPDVEMTEAEASSEIAAVAAPSEDVKARTTVISDGVAEAEAAKAIATTTSGSSPDIEMAESKAGTGTEAKQTPTTEAPPSQSPPALLHSSHEGATTVSLPVEETAGNSASISASGCISPSQKSAARTPSPSLQESLYAAEAEYQAAPDAELRARQADEGSAKKSHQLTNKTEKTKKVVTPGQTLYRPSDDDWLSPQLCLVRSQMEAFAAQTQDVKERRSAGGSIVPPEVGQVGLRCRHCAHVPLKLRTKGSVLYPKSVRAIHMAMRNFQRHHLLSCRYMPDSVKTKYSAIKNKAVQSKKDSYIYLAQSCKEMGIIEEGGYLKKGAPEERTGSPVQGVESINRPAAVTSAPSPAAGRSGARSPVDNNSTTSSLSPPQSPQQEAETRRRSNDNVKAASGLLSLFKKSSPTATTTQHQQLRAVAGISDQQPTATSFPSAVANMGGSLITSGIQANFSLGWQQAQLQKQIAYYNAVGSAAAAGTASFSALANGGANVSMTPSAATYPRTSPGALASFSSPGEVAAPDVAAAYYNASEAALTPAGIAARAAAAEATARSSQIAPAPRQDQVQYQAQQVQQQAQAQQDRYAAALSAQQQAQAQVQAQSPALLNGALYDGGGDGLLNASQLAGLGAQLNVGPSGAALSSIGVGGSGDLSTLLDTTCSSETAGAAADDNNSSNPTQKMKLLARADYLRYLSTLNRMSATIALAQRQASLLQSYPTNHALQADYQATLATMNEEMASAKILALGLREWQLAIDSDSLSQHFQAKRAQDVAQMELALRRMA